MNDLDFSIPGNDIRSPSYCLEQLRRWRRANVDAPFSRFVNWYPIQSREIMLELATSDLISRVSIGQPVRAETYIDASPLLGDLESQLDLIDAEICARTEMGDHVEKGELLCRFPELVQPLNQLLKIHELDGNGEDRQHGLTSNSARWLGPYRLIQPLHCTCDCKYWHAEDARQPGSRFIICWFSPDPANGPLDENLIKRALNRVQGLRHRCLMPITEFGIDDNCIYLAFPERPGPLISALGWHGLGQRQAVKVVRDVVDAMDYAGAQGVPLSGIRIGDLLWMEEQAWVLDFGLSSFMSEIHRQRHSPVFGAPHGGLGYDQIREIGLLIFSLVVGESDTDELELHLAAGHAPLGLHEIDESVSVAFSELFASCLHSAPHDSISFRKLKTTLDRILKSSHPGNQAASGWLARMIKSLRAKANI